MLHFNNIFDLNRRNTDCFRRRIGEYEPQSGFLINKNVGATDTFCRQSGNPSLLQDFPIEVMSTDKLDNGQMLDSHNRLFNRATTYFCRNDIDWRDFGKYLLKNFDSIEDTDIYCFGCSSGQEAYSLAILLKKYFGDKPFKINASDIISDRIKDNIAMQKNGIAISFEDFIRIHEGLGLNKEADNKFFLIHPKDIKKVQLRPNIVNSVQFEQKNILNCIDDLDENKKSIILCRNLWPYIDSEKYDEFAENLYDKLASGSIVVFGDYDHKGEYGFKGSGTFPKILELNNFKPVKNRAIGARSPENVDCALIYKKE